ncbi:MAG: hypothetical protein ACRD96_19920, partial [Bryobacteraceae bacterium]
MTRRAALAALFSAPAFGAARRIDRRCVSAITDEIATSPAEAIAFAKQYGLEWIELRGVPGPKKEYARLPETDVRAAAAELAASGLKVSFLNTSLLKFAWPGTEPLRRPPGPNEQTRFDRRLDDLGQAIRAAHL